jgi:TPR repeat protein
MAIDLGSINSMVGLARYYDNIEKDYDMMKKYYLMAIDYGNINSMLTLGQYYGNTKDYDMMKKYYLMAYDNGDARGINNLVVHYRDIEKNYAMMEKYRIMSKLKSANQKDECMVCYEENKKMYYTSCNRHYICFECSVKLFEKKCPMCRQ